jgi:hypothetical protein
MVRLPEVPDEATPSSTSGSATSLRACTTTAGRITARCSRTFITRYPAGEEGSEREISEPVKPIVYYVDPATPAKFVPYVKQGIEAWKPAFEAAGFRNAIVAKEAPQG